MASILARAASSLAQWFPERQIYIRSKGQVQFCTLGPVPQLLLFALGLVFLAWASFATVNVIFKDRIIAAADHRYQNMRQSYEDRLAKKYASFDELNADLANTEYRARAVVTAMQQRQAAFVTSLTRYRGNDATEAAKQGLSRPEFPGHPEAAIRLSDHAVQNNEAAVPAHSGFYEDIAGLFSSFMHITKAAAAPRGTTMLPPSYPQHPTLIALNEDTKVLQTMSQSANFTIQETGSRLLSAIGRIRETIARTGIQPSQFVQGVATDEGVGGPDIPLAQVRLEGISDRTFSQSYLEAEALLSQLESLSSAILHVPLALPVDARTAHPSSGFGPRLDPFTGRYSFHPGLDFSGPAGTAIYATAPGTVIFAGFDGTYGNMVEIDHGLGFHTRYAHLSGINVQIGTQLAKGAEVGRLGTTGRSTGPHLHYEIWYEHRVRDPGRFLDAGPETGP